MLEDWEAKWAVSQDSLCSSGSVCNKEKPENYCFVMVWTSTSNSHYGSPATFILLWSSRRAGLNSLLPYFQFWANVTEGT